MNTLSAKTKAWEKTILRQKSQEHEGEGISNFEQRTAEF
jgi:hypothetical protein